LIFGIGTDVVQLSRIEATYERYGEHLIRRLLLPAEEALFRQTKRPARFLAMRFAAKEAIVKAMGTGFAHGMWIRDSGFVPNQWGRPDIIWSERGRALADKMGIGEGHITLTDEAGLIVAVAVLMKKGVGDGA
jgi:holo-[acyl-carrier protein] synthase